jgi:negative modulator of initiation of replication
VKTIEIDDEVFGDLLKNVSDFGETPNSVLRRLLRIGGAGAAPTCNAKLPIQDFVDSTEFRFAKGVVGRFLVVLSWLYAQNKEAFTVVEGIRGRERLYFSKSAEELERSGRSVNPKKIPSSPYWVITTTPTDLKQEMLSEVMKVLECDSDSIRVAVEALAR